MQPVPVIAIVKRLAMACLLLAVMACKDEPGSGSQTEAVDRSQLCRDGGAALNAATNECVCGSQQVWNGIRCEGQAGSGGQATASAVSHAAPITLPPTPSEPGLALDGQGTASHASAATAAGAAEVGHACKAAGAEWVEGEGYCRCSEGRVLVGKACRPLDGRVTAEVCRQAVHRGQWVDGACECRDGYIFAPSRGGCRRPYRGHGSVLAWECESSVNKGTWDGKRGRCQCPGRRVWKDELCQLQQMLASQEVCESEYNDGNWDKEHKRCNCPYHQVWLNQSCQNPRGIADKVLCTSEAGGGRWDEGKRRCDCVKGHWHPANKRCE